MKLLLVSVLSLTLLSCAGHNTQTSAPPQNGGVMGTQTGAPFRNGDTFDLRLSGVDAQFITAFNGNYTIDDDGMINLPYLGQVKVAGLLPNQIQVMIQNLLVEKKIFTHPTIAIQSNAARLVNLMGEVKSPQRVAYTPDMTLMTAINACGGFSDYADRKHIKLIRDGKITIYNGKDIARDPSTDPKVLPGDQIVVPASII